MDDTSDDAPPPAPPEPILTDDARRHGSAPPGDAGSAAGDTPDAAGTRPSEPDDDTPPPPPDPIPGPVEATSDPDDVGIDLGRSTWTGWDDEPTPAPDDDVGIDLGRSTWTGWDDEPTPAPDDDVPPAPSDPILPSAARRSGADSDGSSPQATPASPGRDAAMTPSSDGDDRHGPVPATPPTSPPGDGEPPPPAGRSRRRRWLWWGAAGALVVVLVGVAFAVWAWVLWGRIDRVDLSATFAPASGGGTNYLVVGTDSRDGVDTDNPNAGVIFGDGTVTGERTDTVLVLRIGGSGGDLMMALPRDLWLPIDGGGEERINTAFARGPDALVRTVQGALGIPIQHYVEVDFAGFLGLVDAVGGVTIPFEHPAYDTRSGLSVAETGDVHLDADQALAYVRSRAYTEVVDGRDVVDPTGDLGRVERQQTFLRAVFDEVGGTRNPFTLLGIVDSLSGNIRLDDDLGLWDAFGLARRLRGLDPESVELPTFGFTTSGGAAVLGLADGADEALARFR